ncbi:hypothetical protein, conserved [Trypanosoma brucei brucei TREU927]|uniref:Uncharacterized protein n=1 Tax=Trypanosoma brucei brucei (strain 927/4 GUTat10.1) TaxID=185431 RepID=Q57UB9_TRYB2|nr:hypothetical protein, conserved [Trypanosoma brucei brucei TREU927]AAX70800.1 hypothetical protein, conserved [Trypanosoma brucei]AAZ11458.1 hypothetical protein, conserved [Trypanosoma brucei brucei TREU927]
MQMRVESPHNQRTSFHKSAVADSATSSSRNDVTTTANDSFFTAQHTGVDVLHRTAAAAQETTTADDGLPFGNFLFDSMQSSGIVQPSGSNTSGGEGDVAQPALFDGFCFDYLCSSDDAWPTGGVAPSDGPARSVEAAEEVDGVNPFRFLSPSDTAALRAESLCVDFTFDSTSDELKASCVAIPTETSTLLAAEPPHAQGESATAVDLEVIDPSPSEECDPAPAVAPQCSTQFLDNGGNSRNDDFCISRNSSGCMDPTDLRLDTRGDQTPFPLGSKAKSGPGASGTNTAASRVSREGVEELLLRAQCILNREITEQAASTSSHATNIGSAPMAGALQGDPDPKGTSDAMFSAQVSHWLRRGEELHECALTTISELQLRLTHAMQMFGAHTSLSSTLSPQYANTPVVLTLPLVLPLMRSLSEDQ